MSLDLPLTIIWTVSLFVAAALGGAIVQWISRGARLERDTAHAATERSQAATIEAQKLEREANTRRIAELEALVNDSRTRIAELEGTIRAINENVTGRPAFAELASFITRGFELMEKAQQLHDDRMGERQAALVTALRELGVERRLRRSPKRSPK